MKSSLQRTQTSLEELRQENSELLSRVTSQTKELHQLTQLKEELQSKLAMQEILTQQLQSSSQPSTPLGGGGEKIEQLEEKVTRLSANLQSLKREKDQSLSDVTALREALLNTQQENARKVCVDIGIITIYSLYIIGRRFTNSIKTICYRNEFIETTVNKDNEYRLMYIHVYIIYKL